MCASSNKIWLNSFRSCLVGLLLASLSSYVLLSNRVEDWLRYWYLLVVAGVVALCFLLVRGGRVRLASFLLLAGGLALTIWFQIEYGPGTRLSYLSLVFVAIAWLLLGSQGGLIFAAAVALTTLVLFGRSMAMPGSVKPGMSIDVSGFLVTLAGLISRLVALYPSVAASLCAADGSGAALPGVSYRAADPAAAAAV
ncbi:MAG: hypothetical protein KatS3mg057_1373 [Herpetosiphonaceae bacterium]|nr:MAG: hypothetical protein KatS3mg057_1373 [Herpetosiphonaceae bacterium]